MKPRSSRQGFVLVAVLWLLAIFAVVALGYARTTRFRSQELANEVILAREDSLFRSALQMAEFHFGLFRQNRVRFLSTGLRDGFLPGQREMMWYPRHESYPLLIDDEEVFVRLEPEGARMAVASMTSERWFDVLGACGVEDETERMAIVAAILDWQDPDSLLHIGGAEQDYYESLAVPYACKNAPLENLEELMLVRGITPELFHGDGDRPGLLDFVSLEGKSTMLDVNSAAPAAFRIVRGIAPDEIARIVELRRQAPILNMAEAIEDVAFSTGAEMKRFFQILNDTGQVRAIVSHDPDPRPGVRVATRIVKG
jgi:general secretion pathway protein K